MVIVKEALRSRYAPFLVLKKKYKKFLISPQIVFLLIYILTEFDLTSEG
jgi:hypothetical protein